MYFQEPINTVEIGECYSAETMKYVGYLNVKPKLGIDSVIRGFFHDFLPSKIPLTRNELAYVDFYIQSCACIIYTYL